MSDDDSPKLPLFLEVPKTESSRREVLQFLSAFGVTLAVPSLAQASGGGGGWAYIPHGNIIAKALEQPAWRQQLVNQPKLTLAQGGLVLGKDVTVQVVQDSLQLVHVVICMQPGMRGPEEGVAAEILQEYRSDPVFRQQLQSNPYGVFEQWTGATIPAGVQVVVVQETPMHRVIHLPPLATEGLTTPAQVQQASWGGDGGGGWGGGGDDWSVEGTIESGQVCNCWSEGSDFESQAPNCCIEVPEDQFYTP